MQTRMVNTQAVCKMGLAFQNRTVVYLERRTIKRRPKEAKLIDTGASTIGIQRIQELHFWTVGYRKYRISMILDWLSINQLLEQK